MNLSFTEYKDKVRACFLGKNIGGTLGTPFEGKRGVFDVTGYTHDVSKGALPNDDLDLQLVFLCVAERYGTKLDSSMLAEFWMNRIIAHWSEYGMAKCNMRMGLMPPLSGGYMNPNGDSCGCFIRSEIWACLAPGHPEIAVKYALEDAIVDHRDEGVYGEIFTAALEAAAFAETDRDKLIDIAFSYIPADSAVAGAVSLVRNCYNEGLSWRETRVKLLNTFPSSFAHVDCTKDESDRAPVGKVGFDAPANIGIAMIGWFYGEGDFGKSLCIAASCGEDADCTCATLGSIFGIIGGTASIPDEWIKPIGEDIKTVSLDLTAYGTEICKNINQLRDRIARLVPTFLGNNFVIGEDGASYISMNRDDLYNKPCHQNFGKPYIFDFKDELKRRQPWTVKVSGPVFDAYLDYCGSIEIHDGEEKELHISADTYAGRQFWANVTVYAPSDWEVLPARNSMFLMNVNPQSSGLTSETTIRLVPHNLTEGIYRFPIEIHITDRPTSVFIPVTLIVK